MRNYKKWCKKIHCLKEGQPTEEVWECGSRELLLANPRLGGRNIGFFQIIRFVEFKYR